MPLSRQCEALYGVGEATRSAWRFLRSSTPHTCRSRRRIAPSRVHGCGCWRAVAVARGGPVIGFLRPAISEFGYRTDVSVCGHRCRERTAALDQAVREAP